MIDLKLTSGGKTSIAMKALLTWIIPGPDYHTLLQYFNNRLPMKPHISIMLGCSQPQRLLSRWTDRMWVGISDCFMMLELLLGSDLWINLPSNVTCWGKMKTWHICKTDFVVQAIIMMPVMFTWQCDNSSKGLADLWTARNKAYSTCVLVL